MNMDSSRGMMLKKLYSVSKKKLQEITAAGRKWRGCGV
jgi:hypothetical protein